MASATNLNGINIKERPLSHQISTSSATQVRLTNQLQGNKRKKKRLKSQEISQVSIELSLRYSSEGALSLSQLASDANLEDLKKLAHVQEGILEERDQNGATLLHLSAASNQTRILQYLIEGDVNLNYTDTNGNTALHLACDKGHLDAVQQLLGAKASDTILNKASDAPLHIVVRNNHTELLKAFLEYPVDILVKGYRQRIPLHVAAERDNLEACEILHNNILLNETHKNVTGFRLCAADSDDLTPIHLAARSGSHRVLSFMINNALEHGYTPVQVLSFLDEENSTPLHAAVDGGHIQVIEVLLKHKAHPDKSKGKQLPPFLLASAQGKLNMMKLMIAHCGRETVHCRDMYGQTALHRCAHAINSVEIIQFLVENGADVDAIDDEGRTPIIAAIKGSSLGGLKVLLAAGANIFKKDRKGLNPLHYAVKYKRKFLLSCLLEVPNASELVTDCDKKGNSPIHNALSCGLNNLVALMVTAAAHQLKNIRDEKGNNYLHLAAGSGDWKAISILLDIPECQKLLNQTNKFGDTPLHLAAGGGHVRALESLLSNGAMVHRCYWGNTPFMYACYKGHADVARLLYDAHPFQLTWVNDAGENALHLGAQGGSPEVITLLLDIGVPVIMNHKQETFLDILISQHLVGCATAAIKHKRWQECLDVHSPQNVHPMISLIQSMPEVAKLVLDRSLIKADVPRTDPEYYETYNFKYLHLCTDKEEDPVVDQSNERRATRDSDVLVAAPAIKYKGQRRKSSFHFLHSSGSPKKSTGQRLEVLQNMVRYNRVSLLTHPVVESYLKSKWQKYGRLVQLSKIIVNVLQITLLLVFTLLAPSPTELRNPVLRNVTINCSAIDMNITGNCTTLIPEPVDFSTGATVARFFAMGFALINLLRLIVVIVRLGIVQSLNIIRNAFVLIDGLSVLFTLIFTIPWTSLNSVIWEAGAVAFFFAWFSLFLTIQLFDLFGVYITMFLAITRNVFEVLVIAFFFLAAFGLSLFILIGNLPEFSNIGKSIFKNFAYLFGDFSYIFFLRAQEEGQLYFETLTFIFVVVITIIMAIAIQNLLIGLALGHIEKIRLNAIAEKRAVEIGFYKRIDSDFLGKRFTQEEHTELSIYPNKNVNWTRKVWRYFWRTLKGLDPNQGDEIDELTSSNVSHTIEHKLESINERIDELAVVQDKMIASHEKMMELLNQLVASQPPKTPTV